MNKLEFAEDYIYEKAFTPSTILDDLEPQEPDIYQMAYKNAGKRFLYCLNAALSFIIESKDKRIAIYQVAFVFESAICEGKSMEEIADKLGCTRACLSKGAKAFCRMSGLPPSSYMKKEGTSNSYRKARIKSIKNANKGTNKQ